MAQGAHKKINGTTLWVEDTGESNLPVVLCLHSCFLDGTMFDGLVKAAEGKFRVIRPDFRGQGKSAVDDVDIISMDQCAEDMQALIDTMGIKSINVMAQSMGGDVAFRLIARRRKPQRCHQPRDDRAFPFARVAPVPLPFDRRR